MKKFRRAGILLAALAMSCTQSSPPAAKKPPGGRTEVVMVTSTQKRQWLELAVQRFRTERPDIKVMIKFAGPNEEIRDIVAGDDHPTIFSANDGAVLADLDTRWRARHGTDLYAKTGEDAPQLLSRSPYVFFGNERAIRPMLSASDGTLSWSDIQAEVRRREASHLQPLRFGHTPLGRGSVGLNLVLMVGLELFNVPALTLEQAQDPRLSRRLDELEAAVALIAPTSATLAKRFGQGGPDGLDLIYTFENVAIELVQTLADHWGQPLRVYYPRQTLWSDHSAVVLRGDWVTPEQRAAAFAWLRFLETPAMQLDAGRMGLRPRDGVPPDANEGTFAQLKEYGVRRKLPPPAPKPAEAVARALASLAQRPHAVASAARQ
jgi:hypothetical protein